MKRARLIWGPYDGRTQTIHIVGDAINYKELDGLYELVEPINDDEDTIAYQWIEGA